MERTVIKQTRVIISDKSKRTLVEILIYFFILLFLYAATSKLLTYNEFVIQIQQSPLLSDFALILAWAVPGIEIMICILLFFPKTQLSGLYASFSLMIAFTGYIIAILTFSTRVPCSCGGILEKMNWTDHLIFNVVVTLLMLLSVFAKKSQTG